MWGGSQGGALSRFRVLEKQMEDKEEARRRKKEVTCEHNVRADWVEREKDAAEEQSRQALERRIAARAMAGQSCRKRVKARAQQVCQSENGSGGGQSPRNRIHGGQKAAGANGGNGKLPRNLPSLAQQTQQQESSPRSEPDLTDVERRVIAEHEAMAEEQRRSDALAGARNRKGGAGHKQQDKKFRVPRLSQQDKENIADSVKSDGLFQWSLPAVSKGAQHGAAGFQYAGDPRTKRGPQLPKRRGLKHAKDRESSAQVERAVRAVEIQVAQTIKREEATATLNQVVESPKARHVEVEVAGASVNPWHGLKTHALSADADGAAAGGGGEPLSARSQARRDKITAGRRASALALEAEAAGRRAEQAVDDAVRQISANAPQQRRFSSQGGSDSAAAKSSVSKTRMRHAMELQAEQALDAELDAELMGGAEVEVEVEVEAEAEVEVEVESVAVVAAGEGEAELATSRRKKEKAGASLALRDPILDDSDDEGEAADAADAAAAAESTALFAAMAAAAMGEDEGEGEGEVAGPGAGAGAPVLATSASASKLDSLLEDIDRRDNAAAKIQAIRRAGVVRKELNSEGA
jgi:hypothetical protein